jgi:N-acylglucosamine-6-phosphate 2-epimerase
MADISTLEEGVNAANAGADLVSTTLSGYTEHTKKKSTGGAAWLEPPDLELVSQLVSRVSIPVVAEGRYWDERLASEAFKRGAHNVVIGTGITRPQIITQKIADNIQKYL